jgi:hypothetical protein
MKKATALTLAGLMAVSSVASASMSRWNGFGASQAFIADVQDIWTLPGVAASNADATYFEFGAGNGGASGQANVGFNNIVGPAAGAWAGSHITLGPGVLAIWGNRPYLENTNILASVALPPANNSTGAAPALGLLVPRQTIDLIYAFNLSDTLQIGVGINMASNGTKTETVTTATTTVTEQASSDFGISLGGEIKEMGAIKLLEVGLQYNMLNQSNTNNNGTVTNKYGATGADLDLRIGADLVDGNKFQRIEVGVNTDSLNVKSEPAAPNAAPIYAESKKSAMAWNLGWAMGKSSDKGMGLGGFMLTGLGQSRNEENNVTAVNKLDRSTMTLAFVSAGEAKVKEWLSARAGFSTTLWGSTSTVTEAGATGATTKTTVSTPGAPATTLTAGLSFIFGDITIDGVLNQDLLYTGTYFVSGVPASLNSQVSATWGWGGSKE